MAEKSEKQNSAFRLYRFIQKMVPQQPETMLTAQALLSAFGVPKDLTQREQNAVLARVMVLLFTEVESLTNDLRRLGHSEDSIHNIAKPFDSISAGGLANQWRAYKEGFAASLPMLLFAGEVLPEDGEAVTQTELSDLSESIEKLRTEVRESTLPEEAKRFVFEQLDIISRAIRDYPLAGTKAFKTAVSEAIFHAGEHADVVAEYQNTPVMTRLKQIQVQAVKYAKYTIEVSKFVGALDSLYHHVQGAPEAVHHLTGLVKNLLK